MKMAGKGVFRSIRQGFTLIEVLVVIGIIGLLLAILLPAAEHVRHEAYIASCSSNLRQIGIAIINYSNDNQGNYPRTNYVQGAPLVKGTGISAPDSFGPGGPSANDLTASIYLLRKTQKIPAEVFICPYIDEVTYVADKNDPATHSNFADWSNNLGYSFANPYPDAVGTAAGYRLTNHLEGNFPIAADRNPGLKPPRSDVTAAAPGVKSESITDANSINHEQDGQNILFADGHVSFEATPLSGVNKDNIYTNQSNQVEASPTTADDAVLLPAD